MLVAGTIKFFLLELTVLIQRAKQQHISFHNYIENIPNPAPAYLFLYGYNRLIQKKTVQFSKDPNTVLYFSKNSQQ